ncbi:MAG: site-specific DNA-methyltransferase [Calditrichaeota bacterium]|nr:site-specific DNA-methyltransferase [Calditrichota bacterium]
MREIIQGDCLEFLPDISDESFQSVITDPPYCNVLDIGWDRQWKKYNEYLDWSIDWIDQCMRILKSDGLFFIFGQLGKREHIFIHLMSRLCTNYQFHDLIIWDRAVGYNERRDSFTPAYEMILVLHKSDNVKFNKDAVREPYDAETIKQYLRDKRYKDRDLRLRHLEAGKFSTNILRVPSLKGSSKEKCDHPSQKPIELIAKLVLCSTDPGDAVLDPFFGSGTVGVVCETLNRQWLGIEIDPGYVQVAQRRIELVRQTLFSQPQPAAAESVERPARL